MQQLMGYLWVISQKAKVRLPRGTMKTPWFFANLYLYSICIQWTMRGGHLIFFTTFFVHSCSLALLTLYTNIPYLALHWHALPMTIDFVLIVQMFVCKMCIRSLMSGYCGICMVSSSPGVILAESLQYFKSHIIQNNGWISQPRPVPIIPHYYCILTWDCNVKYKY